MSAEDEQELVDRLTGRLRGFQTNREYWTQANKGLSPFMMDEDITSQCVLIARHLPKEVGVISPSLVCHLWRAWAGLSSPWVWYSTPKGNVFEKWLAEEAPKGRQRKSLLMPPVRLEGA